MRSFRGQCGKSASIISSHERACLDLICKAHSWLGLCVNILLAFQQFVLWMNLLQKQSVATVRRYHVQSRKLVFSDLCLKLPAVHLGSTWHIFQSGQWLALSSDCHKNTTLW
mmetsp:Transcript_143322/g.248491  ORF Transcript_143322/g.248491 Transcript_143322/m.248491 type:complete len:112 (+) Transcript_143322:313-648(+)